MTPRKFLLAVLVPLLIVTPAAAQRAGSPAPKTPLVERAGDVGFIQIQAPSFTQLDARQKALAYWLTQASIAIDPIVYDQLSASGLREKRLIEGVMAHHAGIAPPAFKKIREYALLFW